MDVHLKFTYAPNKRIALTLGSDRPKEHSEVVLAAFAAHVKLKQFWAVFATTAVGFATVLVMVCIGHIGAVAALDFVMVLCVALLAHYHAYGKAYDKINALMQTGKEL